MERVEGFYTIGEILQSLYCDKIATLTKETEITENESKTMEMVCRISDLLDGMRENDI